MLSKSTKIKKHADKKVLSKSQKNLTPSSQFRSQESSKRQSPEVLRHRKIFKEGKRSEDKDLSVDPQKINQKYLIEEFFESDFYKSSLEKYKKLYQKKDLHDYLVEWLIKENSEILLGKTSNLLRIEMVENNKEFEFDYGDLEKIFCNFGKIEKIIVKPKGVAFILFEDMLSAYFGQKIMDNFLIAETEMKLRVQLCVVEPEDFSKKENYFEKTDEEIKSKFLLQRPKTSEDDDEELSMEGHKFFTKLYIEVGHQKFDLINRILGVKGCNFMRIFHLCNKNLEEKCLKVDESTLRLKLQIIKEDQTEACVIISSISLEKFNQAVRYTHELLANVYEEYKKYCEMKNLPYNSSLHIKKMEKFIQEPELKFIESKID